jgi:hypothetical protein
MLRPALAAAVAASLTLVSGAVASAPPVGTLPAGPVQTIAVARGQLVAVALPHRAHGLTWRLARGVDAQVLREVSEADVGKHVVVVFAARGRGHATLAYGLTRGETTGARASLTFRVTVR